MNRRIAIPSVLLSGLLAGLFGACQNQPAPAQAPTIESLQITNLRTPMPGVHTSGQPTPEQFAQLAAAGTTRVIQLRLATEKGSGWEEEQARAAGVQFVRVPVDGADGLSIDNVRRFADELGADHDGDLLVCCGSSNRVGALFALRAFWLEGKSSTDALAIGKAAGLTKLEPKVRELMQAPK
ncbi:MAG: hypothetical protein KDC48_13935 [Planctomycetes bacterium]|nr:hypothetical protein [Planctomycetota bacterium]